MSAISSIFGEMKHTKSSPPPPYSVDSDTLASIPLLTLSSQTPSQLHSCCLSLDSDVRVSISWLLVLRYARHAFQAPVLPAASKGNISRAQASSKELFIYCRTSRMLVVFVCEPVIGRAEEFLEDESSGGGLIASLRFCRPSTYEPLTFLEEASEEAALPFWALPNQCGNPCLKLKPPEESLSSSDALTVSENEDPVVYRYVVRGATRG